MWLLQSPGAHRPAQGVLCLPLHLQTPTFLKHFPITTTQTDLDKWNRCSPVKHSTGIPYLFSFPNFSWIVPFLTIPSLIWCKEPEVKGFLPTHNSLPFFFCYKGVAGAVQGAQASFPTQTCIFQTTNSNDSLKYTFIFSP